MAAEDPWYVTAFGSRYLDVYPHRDLESARVEATWLASRGVRGRVLDLCCGFGRHALALRELGMDVVGIDLSPELLRRASSLPGADLLTGRLLRADARRLPLGECTVDSALILFSSFGYFDDGGDRTVLEGLARVLRTEGLLALDLMNPERVRTDLIPESRTTRGVVEVRERRSLEAHGRRVVKYVDLLEGGQEVGSWKEDVRLYEPAEIEGLLRHAGFEPVHRYGGLDGAPFGPRSPRQLVLARRRV